MNGKSILLSCGILASLNLTSAMEGSEEKGQTISKYPQCATTNITLPITLPVIMRQPFRFCQTTPISICDSLGQFHSLVMTWRRKEADPSAEGMTTKCRTWMLSVSSFLDINGAKIGEPYATGMLIDFDQSGVPLSFDHKMTPPSLSIEWINASASSHINLYLGTIGSKDGLTCSGRDYLIHAPIQVDGHTQTPYVKWGWD